MQPPASLDLNNVLDSKFFDAKLFNPEYLFDKVYQFFHKIFPYIFRSENIDILKTVLSIFCIFFLIVSCYSLIRLFEIRRKERKHLQHEIEEYAHHQAEKEKSSANQGAGQRNERWGNVLKHLFLPNPNDWRLAIMEADSMLDNLMTELGFKGESLGEKLKSASQDKFSSLTSAWEVHTIRNKIAHEGLAFEVSQHEAKRVIAIYEQIFRQYGYI